MTGVLTETKRSTVQKLTVNKKDLKRVCKLKLSEDPLTVKPRLPVLIVDTSISDNASVPSNTRTPRRNAES